MGGSFFWAFYRDEVILFQTIYLNAIYGPVMAANKAWDSIIVDLFSDNHTLSFNYHCVGVAKEVNNKIVPELISFY